MSFMRRIMLGFMTLLMLTPVLTCVMAFCPMQSAQAAYGKQYGVTQEQFDACVADKQLQEKIMARMQDGSEKFAINSTPSFVLNGEKTESLNSVARLTKALDAALGENKP